MKHTLLSMICGLSLIVLPVIASEHVDSKLFDKTEITFDSALITDASNTLPKHISVISEDAYGKKLEANLHSFTFAKVAMKDGITYNRILLPNGGGVKIPGNPNIESYSQMLVIPHNAEAVLTIDEIVWSDTFTDKMIDPVQLPFPDVALINGERPDEQLPFVKNKDAYLKIPDSTAVPIRFLAPVHVRGKKFITVGYHPIDFNSVEKTVRFATKVRFHLQYFYPEMDSNKQQRQDPLLDDLSQENEIELGTNRDLKTDIPLTAAQMADYLIITPPNFVIEITPLAEWKRQMGYQVYIATTDVIGSSQQDIKDFIKDAYENGVMTSYVLLVGDHEDLPAWEYTGHPFHGVDHIWHTDFEYGLLDGDDSYADIVVGRFPGETEAQIVSMVNKTLIYERNPIVSDRYNDVLLAGQFQDDNEDFQADRLFMEDLHRMADFLGPDYDFFADPVAAPGTDPFNKGFKIHTALKWDSSPELGALKYGGWDYGDGRITPPEFVPQVWKQQGDSDKVEITATINAGVGFVVHRDHGYDGGHGWADPDFQGQNVNNLANNIPTVVFSLNCATGWFDGRDEFAEAWMRNPNGGAVGFTGAARVSYSGYNDLFHVGIMDSFWEDYDENWSSAMYLGSWRPAIALNRAKERVFSQYTENNEIAVLTARLFTWFGDPELELRTTQPQQLYADHENSLTKGEITTFNVAVRTDAAATGGARVALVFPDGESLIGYTDASGRIAFNNFKVEQPFEITITEHNGIPYQAAVSIEPAVPLIPLVPAQPIIPTPPVTTKIEPTIATSAASIDWMLLIFMMTLSLMRNHKYSK